MLKSLRKNPFMTGLLVTLLYGLWFVVPMFFKDMDPNAHGTNGIDGAMKMWSSELITAFVLATIITLLGWWRNIGFRSINKDGFKFLLPIIVLILLLLNLAWVQDESHKWFLGFDSPAQLISLLSVLLLLGFVEEGVFRGVLFYGLSTKLTPFYTVLITALIFGSFHFVNIFTGEALNSVIYQAIHASAMGFLYASLRLRLGAIWPLMILHTLWDFSLFVLQSANQNIEQTANQLTMTAGLSISIPALLYGIFVYWRWSKEKVY